MSAAETGLLPQIHRVVAAPLERIAVRDIAGTETRRVGAGAPKKAHFSDHWPPASRGTGTAARHLTGRAVGCSGTWR
jgi:hypothetical protein